MILFWFIGWIVVLFNDIGSIKKGLGLGMKMILSYGLIFDLEYFWVWNKDVK